MSLCPDETGWKSLLLGKNNYIDYRCWFFLKDLRTLYAPHLLYSSEVVYKEPEVVDKLESEVVDESDPKPPDLVEPDIIDEPNSEVVDEEELEPEVEKPLIDCCRSSGRAYHGGSAIFDSYILEIA